MSSPRTLLWLNLAGWLAIGGYLLSLPPEELRRAAHPPRLEISTPRLDLGQPLTGQRAVGSLYLSNSGTTTLHLFQLRPGPDMQAMPAEARLKPGQQLKVSLQLDVRQPGPVQDWLNIHSDDPDHPLSRVEVQAQARSPLQGHPSVRRTGLVTHRQVRLRLPLIPAPGLELKVSGARCSLVWVKVTAVHDDVLDLEIDPPSPGTMEGDLEVALIRPLETVVHLPVHLEVEK